MFPRHSPPMQWAHMGYVAPSAGALSRRGGAAPPLPSGQESQWFTPSSLPFQSYQQFSGSHQVPPRPMGYPVARISPGAPTPIYPAVNPEHTPCLPCHQSPDSSQHDPSHLNSKSYQQPSENTQADAHESSGPVPDLRTSQDDRTHFKPLTWSSQDQAIGDSTVSSTIESLASIQHEESSTINEKTDKTENAVDAIKASDVPNVCFLKPPKRMFSRKGKCLSSLFRKTPQGFPHISLDFEIYCFLCCRMAEGNNVYEHMFFGNLKCIECGHVVRSCEDFKIVRHNNVECGVSKRKHRLASWADCPVEFLEYSVKQSLVPSSLKDCNSPSTPDVTTEMRNYIEKLSLLRLYKPWKSAFRRCSEYVKSIERAEIDSSLPEDTQKVIYGEEVASVIPGDTEEEINKEVNNVIPGDTEEEIKEEVNSAILGNALEKNNMEDVRRVFPGETQAEINREETNSDIQKDTQEEISRQEIRRDTGRTTFYDLIGSQSERQEEPQMDGISINEALEQYREDSQSSSNDTVTVCPSTSDGLVIGAKQESRVGTFSLRMFKNVLRNKDANDNDTSRISSDQFKDDGDNAGTCTQEPVTDSQQQPILWEPDGDDTRASMVAETETYKGFQCEFSTRISENQAYERSFDLSERLSTSSPEPEDNQVVYYYPSETPPEECPRCCYTLCATMFTLNTTNFRVSTECPDCSLKICIVLKDSTRS